MFDDILSTSISRHLPLAEFEGCINWAKGVVCQRAFTLLTLHAKSVAAITSSGQTCLTTPHFATRQWAELSANVSIISASFCKFGGDEYLARLRKEIESMLQRIAETETKDPLVREAYLMTNYFTALSIFKMTRQSEFDFGDDASRVQHLLDYHRSIFVDTILSKYFTNLIDFLRITERHKDDVIPDAKFTFPGNVDPSMKNISDHYFAFHFLYFFKVAFILLIVFYILFLFFFFS